MRKPEDLTGDFTLPAIPVTCPAAHPLRNAHKE